MGLAQFLLIAAIVDGVFGLGFFLVPGPFFEPFNVTFNPGGLMIARVFGVALLALALIYWWVRNETGGTALKAILRASAFYNAVSAIPIIIAMLGGVSNTLGWIPVLIHFALAAGFFHFGFRRM